MEIDPRERAALAVIRIGLAPPLPAAIDAALVTACIALVTRALDTSGRALDDDTRDAAILRGVRLLIDANVKLADGRLVMFSPTRPPAGARGGTEAAIGRQRSRRDTFHRRA